MKSVLKIFIFFTFPFVFLSCQSKFKNQNEIPAIHAENKIAVPSRHHSEFTFKNFDKTENQKVSLDEYASEMAILYSQLLSETKNNLTTESCKKSFCPKLDKDKDKKISSSEFFNESYKQFKLADINKDNFISENEFASIIQQGFAK